MTPHSRIHTTSGDAVGPGMVYGYVLPLGKRFNIEFSAGISLMWYREKLLTRRDCRT